MTKRKNITKGDIANALHSTAADHVTAVAEDVFDENLQEYQSDINSTYKQELAKKANAEDVEQSFSEQTTKNAEQDVEIAKKANLADVTSQMQTEQTRVNNELAKKFNSVNITQESGEAEDKVMSQKAVSTKLSDLSSDIKNSSYYISIENATTIGEKVILGSGFIYNSLGQRESPIQAGEFELPNDSYLVVKRLFKYETVIPVVQDNISKDDIVLASRLNGVFFFSKELMYIHLAKSRYIVDFLNVGQIHSLSNAIANIPSFLKKGFVKIKFLSETGELEEYELPQSSWTENVDFWISSKDANLVDYNDGIIDFNKFKYINIEQHTINEKGELEIIGNGAGQSLIDLPFNAKMYCCQIIFKVKNKDTWVYFGNGKSAIDTTTTENGYFEKVQTTAWKEVNFSYVGREGFGFCIAFYGERNSHITIKSLKIFKKDSITDIIHKISSTPMKQHVSDGTSLKDMHFKLLNVYGKSWQRIPTISVNFFNSTHNNFIIDWNTYKTNLSDVSSVKQSIDKSRCNLSFTKTGGEQFLLYKTIFKRDNSNKYIRLHIDTFEKGESLACGIFSDDGNKYWIVALSGVEYTEDGKYKINGFRYSSNNQKLSLDYPNYDTDIDYESIVKEGDFDVEFAFFGTQCNVNIIKNGETYPVLKGMITQEDYDIYYDIISNDYSYYIGTTSLNNTNAIMPSISRMECGLSSMWAGGADTKVVKNIDGTTYIENDSFFICSTSHGNDSLPTGGATNIFKIDLKSLKMEFVGVLNGRYNGYVDILQSTSIRYSPSDNYWYIHGTNFGVTANKLQPGSFSIGYIGRTKKNPLGGNTVVDMQPLNLQDTTNCFDFDFLYDSENKYWIGVQQNGKTFKTSDVFSEWEKISDGFISEGFEYTEGSSFAIVNSKLLYTVGNRKDPNSPSIRDFITNEEIASINKDVPCSSSESTTPSWGNIFSIYENGISRYYLICFSGRKIKDMEYGYGDVFLYEAEEISEGEEYI